MDLDDVGLSRESTALPLALSPGDTFRYHVESVPGDLTPASYRGDPDHQDRSGKRSKKGHPQDKEATSEGDGTVKKAVKDESKSDHPMIGSEFMHTSAIVAIEVGKMEREKMTLQVGYTREGESPRSFTVEATRAGAITSVRARSLPGAKTGEEDSTKPSTATKKLTDQEQQQLRSCLEIVLGDKLHGDSLQTDQIYPSGRFLGSLVTERGSMKAAAEHQFSLRYEGTKDVHNRECAVLTVFCASTKSSNGSKPIGSGAGNSDQPRSDDPKSMEASRRGLGRVSYRISDGLLERAVVYSTATPQSHDRIILRRLSAEANDVIGTR
jgi:hypothetical protein